MKKTINTLCFALAVMASIAACKQSSADSAPASRPTTKLKAEVLTKIKATLVNYESLRSALAADKLKESVGLANKMKKNVETAKSNAPSSIATHLANMDKSLTEIMKKESDDDKRRAFGDLSKAVVSMITEHDGLNEKLHIFECPMAQGYQKWVQTSKKLENPYMGGRMLGCGSKSKWTP